MRAWWVVGCLLWVAGCANVRASETIRDEDLAIRSDRFAGTFIQLDSPGNVTVSVKPAGRARIVINDTKSESAEHRFALPAGTHFVRIEAANVSDVSITGARVCNELTDANAVAASETYIKHCRTGDVRIRLPHEIATGSEVRARLVMKEFNFGTNAPGTQNLYFTDNPSADSDAAKFQRFILDHFNMLVPSNAGKWVYHETEPGRVSMEYADAILAFAKRHGLRGRMHTLIWDHAQQPDWANALLDRAVAGDQDAKRELREAISRRIKYYVRDRAMKYVELDVLNESLHQDKYWKVFGADGIADIYREVQQAAVGSAANPTPLLMTNEFNVLQWSRPYPFKDQPFDHYANWYRAHVEELIEHGAPVTGIGIQYNVDCRPEAWEKCPHSPARIFAALQNLSTTGLPLALSEFQITPDATPQQAAKIYYELMRLVYGNANMQSFLVWGFWAGNTPDLAVLANKDWTLTPAGRLYERLMKEWTTDVKVVVSSDRTIAFNGHFGEYEITAGDKTYRVAIKKGVSQYDAR
jgi:GH35 family endo-1,4-beta-xylanase